MESIEVQLNEVISQRPWRSSEANTCDLLILDSWRVSGDCTGKKKEATTPIFLYQESVILHFKNGVSSHLFFNYAHDEVMSLSPFPFTEGK